MSQTPSPTTTAEAPEHPAPVVTTECWTHIGVYGAGTCQELRQFIHCRNCPVYTQAARQLLDRPLPVDYRREWTRHFAYPDRQHQRVRTSVLLFRIQSEWLGLPTPVFQEVAERRPIHSLPHRRTGTVLGLVNIRGELLICVALSRLLGLASAGARETSRTVYDRLLVLHWEGSRLVFPADEVYGIHRFERSDLKDLPLTVARATTTFSRGLLNWHDRVVGVLDAPALFSALHLSLP